MSDLDARLVPTTKIFSEVGVASLRSSRAERECGEGMGVRGRDGVSVLAEEWERYPWSFTGACQ